MTAVLITGASRGIGAILARGFAHAGYDVAALATSPPEELAEELRAMGVNAIALAADVRRDEHVVRAIENAEKALGPIDMLISNAGRIDSEVPIWEADPDEWWDIVETNVRGPFLFARHLVPRMIERGGGRVINLNSGSGTKDSPVATAYTTSKTALFRIGGAIHAAGYEHGIRAFEMAPGVVRTDMTGSMQMHEGRTEWTSPEDVVALALCLAAGDADHLSGTYVRVGVTDPGDLKVPRRILGIVEE